MTYQTWDRAVGESGDRSIPACLPQAGRGESVNRVIRWPLRRDESWVLGIAVAVAALFLGHGLYVRATTVPAVPTYTQADIDRPLNEALWGPLLRPMARTPAPVVIQWPTEIVVKIQ